MGAHEDIFCGVDKWYDNHFAYDQRSSSLDSFKSSFDENGRIYHIFGSCSSSSMTNMYVVDPTGEAIQLDGSWTSCPSGGSGDALQNACSQGTCSSYTPTSSSVEAGHLVFFREATEQCVHRLHLHSLEYVLFCRVSQRRRSELLRIQLSVALSISHASIALSISHASHASHASLTLTFSHASHASLTLAFSGRSL